MPLSHAISARQDETEEQQRNRQAGIGLVMHLSELQKLRQSFYRTDSD